MKPRTYSYMLIMWSNEFLSKSDINSSVVQWVRVCELGTADWPPRHIQQKSCLHLQHCMWLQPPFFSIHTWHLGHCNTANTTITPAVLLNAHLTLGTLQHSKHHHYTRHSSQCTPDTWDTATQQTPPLHPPFFSIHTRHLGHCNTANTTITPAILLNTHPTLGTLQHSKYHHYTRHSSRYTPDTWDTATQQIPPLLTVLWHRPKLTINSFQCSWHCCWVTERASSLYKSHTSKFHRFFF